MTLSSTRIGRVFPNEVRNLLIS